MAKVKRGIGSRLGGISTFLNFKAVFDDAVRRQGYDMEKLHYTSAQEEKMQRMKEESETKRSAMTIRGNIANTRIKAGWQPPAGEDIGGTLASGKDVDYSNWTRTGGGMGALDTRRVLTTAIQMADRMSGDVQDANLWKQAFIKVWPGVAGQFGIEGVDPQSVLEQAFYLKSQGGGGTSTIGDVSGGMGIGQYLAGGFSPLFMGAKLISDFIKGKKKRPRSGNISTDTELEALDAKIKALEEEMGNE